MNSKNINLNKLNVLKPIIWWTIVTIKNKKLSLWFNIIVKNVINKDQLDKLKIKKYSELDKEKYKECVICMEDYKNNSDVRLLNCNHGFHPSCIDTWLTKCNYKCPVCRDSSNEHHPEV